MGYKLALTKPLDKEIRMIKNCRLAILLIIALLVTIQISSTTRTRPSQSSLVLTPCHPDNIKGEAKCGTFEVFENRATRKGRKIKLNVLVLPATGPQRERDALFYFAGGPGSAATEEAAGIAQIFAKIHEHRDLVFVDQRGTGQSNPLNCELFDPADPQSYLGSFFPVEAVKKCREQLEPKADLTLYTTNIAMDDLDDVRAALGYEQINLFGGSYGTRAALVYLRQYPKHVRAVVLHGVAPTNQFMPLHFPQDTERALQGVLAECEADAACHEAFPKIKEEAAYALGILMMSPAETELQLEGTNTKARLRLNVHLAAEAVRYMLYSPVPAGRIPLFLHLARRGNYEPLTQAAFFFRKNLVATGSNGMYLSVTCAEDLPSIKPEEADKLAEHTVLGSYRYDQQSEACALWPTAKVDPSYAEPVRSDKPVLIVTGEWDPVTPPSQGDAAAKTLSNSLHIVVPHGAHGLNGLENINCLDGLLTTFIERGTVKGLDTACIKTIKRKGFQLKL
jgi:pimeloyl-ACP methyl ester carboxylesterase